MAEKIILKVNGMHCAHCEARINTAALAVPGVQAAKADAKKGVVALKLRDEATLTAVRNAITQAGYEVDQ